MAQWILEGFIKSLYSSDTTDLFEKYTFFIVANMNPDVSLIGNHRTNALGKNLNRCWAEPSQDMCPEVYWLQAAMLQYGVDFFFDIHGGEAILHNFMMSKSVKLAGEKFKQLQAEIDTNFQVEYDYDSYKTSGGTSCCDSGCGKSKTATGFVFETFGATSLLLEASYKNLQSPNSKSDWDHHGCVKLGESLFITLQQTF
ncbi:hypothetical protein [Marinomonas posidonica]|uniref:hypothetical protein n=1 Tax=Marinomonas posidonica TaxID=936476 RepID=UPI0002F86F61|nr:hypothetical protein [Marinomonas posidonica]